MPPLPMLLQRLLRLLGRGTARPPAATTAPAAPPPPSADAAPLSEPPVPSEPTPLPDVAAGRGVYLAWLLVLPPAPPRPSPAATERLLATLEQALATPESAARLLRRAPNVVPRLINTLRSDIYSRAEVAEQIERDPVLMAEVLRTARSVLYGHLHRGAPTVAQAVGLLGSEGLRQAIARVLLRPLFNAEGRGLQARAAQRLWDDSERCAALCVALAREQGQDAVDAYLAGLLLNAGWSALLHGADLHGLAPALHEGTLDDPAVVQALFALRDRALGLLLPTWEISPALSALGQALAGAPEAPAAPLQDVLAQAQELAVLRRLQLAGLVPGGLAAPPGCPPWVAAVYRG
jgi:hypothetical protein